MEFHDADTDTDVLARILADTSDTRDSLKLFLWQTEPHADILVTILAGMSAKMSVSVSASWNSSLYQHDNVVNRTVMPELHLNVEWALNLSIQLHGFTASTRCNVASLHAWNWLLSDRKAFCPSAVANQKNDCHRSGIEVGPTALSHYHAHTRSTPPLQLESAAPRSTPCRASMQVMASRVQLVGSVGLGLGLVLGQDWGCTVAIQAAAHRWHAKRLAKICQPIVVYRTSSV